MTDFGYMAGQQVTSEKLSTMTIFEVTMPNGENPKLTGRVAGEKNKPYFNKVLKSTAKRAKQVQAGAVSADMLAEHRNEDRELFPSLVLTGWEVVDAAGKSVTFNADNCAQFLSALPDHVFDTVRAYFAAPGNFADGDDQVAPEDAEAKGKS